MQHSRLKIEPDTEHEQRLLAETLQEVTLVFASQTDPATVLDELLRQAQRLVPFKTSSIALLENNMLRVVRSRGYQDVGSDTFIANLVQQLPDLLLDHKVVQTRQPVVISDVRDEPNWITVKETAIDPAIIENPPDTNASGLQCISTYSAAQDAELTELPELYIAVADTGIGLNEQDMERVFGVFEQIDASYNRQQPGMELGLGSVFSFTVPLHPKN